MQILEGIHAAPGIAISKAFWIQEKEIRVAKTPSSAVVEKERLEKACSKVRQSITEMRDGLKTHPDEAAIYSAHLMLLSDPDLLDAAYSRLEAGAEYAWKTAIDYFAAQLESLSDEYLRSRAGDIRDVGEQVLRVLMGIETVDLSHFNEPVILLARDLAPSDTGRLDKLKVMGFCTLEGSATSHTAILAKTLGIPAVVGVNAALQSIKNQTMLIIDGSQGLIICDPDQETIQTYTARQLAERDQKQEALIAAMQPVFTTDHVQVEVVANIGNTEDALEALRSGADGVGLLRTEFLFQNQKSAPDEETQFLAYSAILETMGDRPVVIRTLDIGGDKSPAYMNLGQESNPFLGWRAIRVCLDRPDFFKTQLRALLRASQGHDVRIMFPMIATLEELKKAKNVLEEAKQELKSEAVALSEHIQVGMMVEIPSVVTMIEKFACQVDFFSIGTNDLTQYTFAVDRTNPKVAALADAGHPAILRQIKQVIDAAHQVGIWVGVCGELAGEQPIIPVLLGLDLDEFSVPSPLIPVTKETIRRWSKADAKKMAAEALNCESAQAVKELVLSYNLPFSN